MFFSELFDDVDYARKYTTNEPAPSEAMATIVVAQQLLRISKILARIEAKMPEIVLAKEKQGD